MGWRKRMVELERDHKRRKEAARVEWERIDLNGGAYKNKSLEFLLTKSGGFKIIKRV